MRLRFPDKLATFDTAYLYVKCSRVNPGEERGGRGDREGTGGENRAGDVY